MDFSFRNLATWDRIVRIGVGLTALALGSSGVLPELGGIALVLFGWVPLATGLLGWCPIYSLAASCQVVYEGEGWRTWRVSGRG